MQARFADLEDVIELFLVTKSCLDTLACENYSVTINIALR